MRPLESVDDEEKTASTPLQIRWRNAHSINKPVTEWLRVAFFTPTTARTLFLGIVAPLVCRRYALHGHMFDPSLLSMLVAMPASFLIGAAFQRREKALQDLAEFRTLAIAVYRSFALYGSPETAAAGQRAVQTMFASL